MKKICLLLILQIFVCSLFAQKQEPVAVQRPEPVNPMKDKQEYQGYTIRLLHTIPVQPGAGNLNFIILKDNRLVMQAHQNPANFPIVKIKTKEEAYKVARWFIDDFKRTGHWQISIPPHIINELKPGTTTYQKN